MDTPIIPPVRICTKCKHELPATREFFSPDKRRKSGLQARCKACVRERVNDYYHSEHGKRHVKNYYSTPECRERHRSYEQARLRKLPPEKREVMRKRRKQYYQENRQEILQDRKEYRNRPDVKTRIQAYRRFPLVKLRHNVHKANRRARELAAEGSHTKEDILLQYRSQHGKCWWCLKPVGKKYQVDHVIPLAKGGTNDPRNLVISCPLCNQSKGSKLPHEWSGRLF